MTRASAAADDIEMEDAPKASSSKRTRQSQAASDAGEDELVGEADEVSIGDELVEDDADEELGEGEHSTFPWPTRGRVS